VRFEVQQRPAPPFGAMFGAVLAVGAVLAALWLRLGLPLPICLFHEWTGLPCPTCGSTRVVQALLAGNLLAALAWNPLVVLVLAALALWAIASVARLLLGLPAWTVVLAPWERLGLRLIAVAVLAVGWVYLIWRGV
jgi:hypothetical protein